MSSSPIFVHSLFRSGSTYFFNVFRRSPAGYYCFQEALHPVVFLNRDKPQDLLKFHTSTYASLRHPDLDKPYFYELVSLPPVWAEKITYSALYDGYFGSSEADNGVEFFRTLLNQVKDKRVVFEECRTAGRIGLLKEELGGFHIYLWRNPWDQWWSYKTTNGFDHQNRLIINAPNSFKSVARLHSELSFQHAYTASSAAMHDGMFRVEESYLVYYLLWCLGLYEGLKNADLLINIDELTESESYRQEIVEKLVQNDIHGVDFSDCKIPCGNYYKEDHDFFLTLEEKVYDWLREDLPSEYLYLIQELREKYSPRVLNQLDDVQQKNFARQLTQIRETSRRFETAKTIYLQKYLTVRNEITALSKKVRTLENSIDKLQNDRFWRLTQPLRWIAHQLRMIRLYGVKNRLGRLISKMIESG